MCCFSQPVERVNRTRIFCRLSGRGTQYVTYQMDYKSAVPNAMILPLPTRQGAPDDALRFIDLSNYDDFFQDLNRGFPPLRRFTDALRIGAPAAGDAGVLAVHEVGDFVASFVPSINEFSRLDPRFVIAADVWAKIPEYGDYGFAVFQLKSLEGKPHPMAFEFPTRFEDRIFFPTVHIHDGEVHDVEEFDHSLYLQDAAFDERAGGYTRATDPETQFVRSKEPAVRFVKFDRAQGIVDGELLVHRRLLHGQLSNKDFIVTTAMGDPRQTVFPHFGMRTLAPLVALLPLGWIIHRRNQLTRATATGALPYNTR